MFDLMIELLIRWLRASKKGYTMASCGLKLANKWYADEGTPATNTVDDMVAFLDLVSRFSKCSVIHLNVN
jgi:hypothetical protein